MKFTALALLAPALALAESLTLDGISLGGSGCPQGSEYTTSGTLESGLTVSFKTTTQKAHFGPGASLSQMRANCQIALSISSEPGTQFSIDRANYLGDADLSDGVIAYHQVNYYFAGTTNDVSQEGYLEGPVDASYVYNQDPPDVWSNCGETTTLNVNNVLRIDRATAANAPGTIQGPNGGQAYFNLNFKTREC